MAKFYAQAVCDFEMGGGWVRAGQNAVFATKEDRRAFISACNAKAAFSVAPICVYARILAHEGGFKIATGKEA